MSERWKGTITKLGSCGRDVPRPVVGGKGKRGAKSGSAADLPERAAPAPALSAKARKRMAKVVRPVLQGTTGK